MRADVKGEVIVFVLLLVLLNIIITAPLLTRHLKYKSSMICGDSYYHCRISQQIADSGVFDSDMLQGKPLLTTLPDFISAFFVYLFGNQACKLVPYLFSIVSVFIFYYLLLRCGADRDVRMLSLLIWIISPAFVYNATVFNPHNLGMALFIPMVLLLMTMKNKLSHFLIVAILLLMNGFVGLFNFLLGIGVVLSFVITRRNARLLFLLTLIIFPLSVYYGKSFVFMRYGESFEGINSIQALFTDLGATIGFGTFDIFLALAGIISVWAVYSRYNRVFLLIAVVMALLFAFPEAFVIYANIGIAVLAAIGVTALWKREWNILLIRGLTLLLIGCGLIFTSLSYMNRLSNSPPTTPELDALTYLGRLPDGIVLSHKDRGFLIEGIAGQEAFVDNINYVSAQTMDAVADDLFYSLNLERTSAILDAHQIRYILIDDRMKKGGVWNKPDEGLLFILENSEAFSRIYDSEGIEIWEYRGGRTGN